MTANNRKNFLTLCPSPMGNPRPVPVTTEDAECVLTDTNGDSVPDVEQRKCDLRTLVYTESPATPLLAVEPGYGESLSGFPLYLSTRVRLVGQDERGRHVYEIHVNPRVMDVDSHGFVSLALECPPEWELPVELREALKFIEYRGWNGAGRLPVEGAASNGK